MLSRTSTSDIGDLRKQKHCSAFIAGARGLPVLNVSCRSNIYVQVSDELETQEVAWREAPNKGLLFRTEQLIERTVSHTRKTYHNAKD